MLGAFGYVVGAGALGLGLYGAGLRLRPLPGWGKPRFLRLSLNPNLRSRTRWLRSQSPEPKWWPTRSPAQKTWSR